MRVAIVGGGIGGLALALSLHDAGQGDVVVLESAPRIEELGVGINVLPHAVRELTELGLADDLAATGIPTAELAMFSAQGQEIWREPRGIAAGYRWPQYSIHRGALLGLLHRAVIARMGAGAVLTGQVVAGVEDAGPSVLLADGSRVEADAVVACDGVHSVVRRQLHPHEGPPLWNGITMWRATVEADRFLDGRTMVMLGRFTHRVVMYPISAEADRRGRSLLNLVLEADLGEEPSRSPSALPPQDWSHRADRAEVLASFGHVRTDWLDLRPLIESAPVWYRYPMVDRDPLPRWGGGRVTLLGDAAHPVYPVGSNGASQAIIDARVLARALALAPSVEEAVAEYERVRVPATGALVLANRGVGAERPMEVVAERAPNGFDRLEDVISRAELEEMSREYKRVAGFDPSALNARESFSVRR